MCVSVRACVRERLPLSIPLSSLKEREREGERRTERHFIGFGRQERERGRKEKKAKGPFAGKRYSWMERRARGERRSERPICFNHACLPMQYYSLGVVPLVDRTYVCKRRERPI